MNYKFTLCLISFFITITASAQIANRDFESWNGNNIDNWISTNGLVLLGNDQSVFQSTDAHSGGFACELISTKVTNKPQGVFVPDYVASIFIGRQIGINSIMGYPYTQKPKQLEFWYKHAPVSGDTASSIVVLTKWNTQKMSRDTIAFGGFFSTTVDTLAYKKGIISLTYSSTLTPDSVSILFSAIKPNSTQGGGKFLIDDLEFTGGTVGIKKTSVQNTFKTFPNPANKTCTVQFNEVQSFTDVELFNVLGQLVWQTKVANATQLVVPTSALKEGTYILNIKNQDGYFSEKLNVIH